MFIDFLCAITASEKNSRGWKLKHAVIEAINELLEDIDNNHAQIAEQALEHIHQEYADLQLYFSKCFLETRLQNHIFL